jgi:hypothetical protein
MTDDAYQETSDLSLAAFAHMRGLEVVRAQEIRGPTLGGAYQYQFLFRCAAPEWDALCDLYANSECARYDGSLRVLKRMCKNRQRRRADVRRIVG